MFGLDDIGVTVWSETSDKIKKYDTKISSKLFGKMDMWVVAWKACSDAENTLSNDVRTKLFMLILIYFDFNHFI